MPVKPLLLDLFCGAGGAAEGYRRAGFEIVGVDIKEQPHYPFRFICADVLPLLSSWLLGNGTLNSDAHWSFLDDFDAIHASPPCQAYTKARKLQGNTHPELIEPTRSLLQLAGLPYVIENVPEAPLHHPVTLNGTMFAGLRTKRDRLFECSWPLTAPPTLYEAQKHTKMGRPPKPGEWMHVVGHFSGAYEGGRAMGIHWMTKAELAEAIPPAYTEYVGWQLRDYLRNCAQAEAVQADAGA